VGNRRFGLIFDSILGSEEIVVQPMNPAVNFIKIFSGATILGDGSVALILDIDGLLNHADIDFNLRLRKGELPVYEKNTSKAESILLFKSGAVEQFAIPVSLIRRIEQIQTSQIETTGNKEFITVKNQSYRIIRLEEIMNVSPCTQRDEMYLIILKFVNRPIGILFSYIIDNQHINSEINTETFNFVGLLGTAIINNEMTLFIDAFRILELAEPDWFDKKKLKEINNQELIPLAEKVKVLLVDDSAVFRQMISKYLIEEGYDVTIATDSINALQIIENQKLDILISDLEMPYMDGFELIKSVRGSALQPNIPAIALTALGSETNKEKALSCGYNKFEVKINKFSFFESISELLSFRREVSGIKYGDNRH
jgi:two-component system chemotaxis sensor kinase CheA